ncbi:MAG: DNA polymerase I [Oculatellaceae cyanobacterium Prado106]|jgi:DNA polymerase-1|nr:DNA polymerase I [Oculatellaceae cyanobacterium Prado106]
MPSPESSKLLLIDGHSLAFRSYYAYAKGRDGGLRTSTGIPTSVSFGFLKALWETIEAERPEYVAIAFDLGDPTFRHEADDTYKAGRAETPEDFIPDIANLQEVLRALNISVLMQPGYEADDIIGTLTRRASAEGVQVKVLSGDRDLFQLVDPEGLVKVLYLSTTYGKGTPPPKEFGVEQVVEKMGIQPSQVVDYKALCGDASDNIPGVKGIGDKTAVQLLKTYGSLTKVYESLDEIKGATKTKLEQGKDAAMHSQYMAQIHLDVPIEAKLEDCRLKGFDSEALVPLLEKLELKQFLGKVNQLQQVLGGEAIALPDSPTDSTPQKRTSPGKKQTAIAEEGGDLSFFTAEETRMSQRMQMAAIAPLIIDTPAKLTELVERLKTHQNGATPVSWDTETTALEPRDAELVGIGCCWGEGLSDMAYIPMGHRSGKNLDQSLVLNALRPILESPKYPKALQNAKFDRLVLRCQGVELQGVVFDTMLASYVLNPEAKHGLSELGLRYLELPSQSYEDLVPRGKTIADMPIPAVADYCGMDVYFTYHLVPKLLAELEQTPELYALLLDIELSLEPVLAEMEYCGIRIDQPYLQQFSKKLETDLHELETKAYEAAGQPFNLGSPKQLGELLFETLGLDRKKSRKTKTGYSTDAAVLEKLQGDHPVVDYVLEHRTLIKLKSTYVDALPALVRADTGRVHTDFNQAVTTTGRLSSSNPNLQNIPVRTAFSRQIRAAFLPEPDWLMVAADYSQIELRILAHLSQEPVLLETYRNNQDVHATTAKLLFEKDEVTPDERRLGKVINFGVIYGMGAQRFAREANVSRIDAKTFIDRFNERYSGIFRYLQRMQQEAIANGYVTTIKGRRRYFNFTSDSIKRLRGSDPNSIDLDSLKLRDQYEAQMLRQAANAPIQGSSADIIKIAMVQLHEVLKAHRANLLLQVHDELVFEVHPDEWESLQTQIKSTMESAVELSVPLLVEVRAGQNWMEAK